MRKQTVTCLIFSGVFSLFYHLGINAQEGSDKVKPDSVQVIKQNDTIVPRVLSVRSLSSGRQKNTAVYGDYIEVKVENLDVLLKMADGLASAYGDSSILLCVNGFPRDELVMADVNRAKSTLVFHLNRYSNTLSKLRVYFKNLWGMLEINNVTVAVKGLKPIPTEVRQFHLLLTSRKIVVFAIIFLIIIVVSMALLVTKTNIIRVGKDGSPFSLSQSQLAFWTLLVSFSIIYVWAVTEEFPHITYSTLGLLGISVGTTAGAKMISYSRKTPIVYKQSDGFFIDILSDDVSVNIHRFQMMLWTVILGVIFVIKVIDQLTIPEFSDDLLILMGISSGTYVLLKNSENKNSGNSTTTQSATVAEPPVNEETPAFG